MDARGCDRRRERPGVWDEGRAKGEMIERRGWGGRVRVAQEDYVGAKSKGKVH